MVRQNREEEENSSEFFDVRVVRQMDEGRLMPPLSSSMPSAFSTMRKLKNYYPRKKETGYSFRTVQASARRRAPAARTDSKPGDFVGAAVAGADREAVGGVAGRVVTTVAGVVTVVGTVVATVVFTVVGALVTTVVGKAVRVLTLISGFCS